MLYVTTRNKNDAYTAARALNEVRGPDGGAYLPFQLKRLEDAQLESLSEKSFGQNVADILNLFFSARVDSWDVDFAIGRYPYRMVSMSHRIQIVETWHNPDWSFSRLVQNLTGNLHYAARGKTAASNWAWIAVRIAVLFGIFGDLLGSGCVSWDTPVDIAVDVGDFSGPMAVWYAKRLGLPIRTIICGCNENGAPWELLHRGELRTNAAKIETQTPLCDHAVPPDLERLIFGVYGYEEIQRYVSVCQRGGVYTPPLGTLDQLREGLFAAVVSQKRMEATIRNVYTTKTYLLGPYSALAYGALQDYRAVTGESRQTLILSEDSPAKFSGTVANAMGMTVEALNERFDFD